MYRRRSLAELGKISFGSRDTSIIRRSVWVTVFFLLGHLCYYCLIFYANRALPPADFGHFYTGWATLNVLCAPGTILVLLLASYFATAFRAGHRPAVLAALEHAAGQLAAPTAVTLLACEAGIIVGGRLFGIDAFPLGLLLPLTAVTIFMVEVVRAAFQGQMRFIRYGMYWTAWCGLQLLLGSVGILMFDAPWAVFAGMCAANVAMLAVLLAGVVHEVPVSGLPPYHERLRLKRFLPLCGSLVGSVILVNLDIFVAYLTFTPTVNGVYAASALLTKAIITATQPIVQITIPVITRVEGAPSGRRVVTLKAISVGAAFAMAGALCLWIGAPAVCGGRYGIQYCDIQVMDLLALAAIPLVIVRVWLIADVAYKRYGVAQLMYAAVPVFIAVAPRGASSAVSLAVIYCVCCWGTLALRCGVQVANVIGGRRRSIREINQ